MTVTRILVSIKNLRQGQVFFGKLGLNFLNTNEFIFVTYVHFFLVFVVENLNPTISF